jgi:D-alanine-D-alanine ligase
MSSRCDPKAANLPPRRLREPAAFGRVAVVMGGASAEREVSLHSGGRVLAGLQRSGVDAHGVVVGADLIHPLLDGRYDRVFIVLHGRGGEDGLLQGALESLAIPYTGSGVLGCALAMDKLRCKQLWCGMGLPTADFRVARSVDQASGAGNELGFPLMVKPVREGSSVGTARADDGASLITAYREAARYDAEVLLETWLPGAEYTGGVLQGEALPLIKLEAAQGYYDYAAKYLRDDTRYICPCGLDAAGERRLRALVLQAFQSVGAQGWGRVDLMLDAAGEPRLLEVNTVPGMTDHSLVPMAARAAGVSFEELVWRILETSLETRGGGR